MKTKKFIFLSITNVLLVIILSIYTIFFGLKSGIDHEMFAQPKENTQIYTIWHIETFEGGSKARIEYLKTIARDLEKQNPLNLFNNLLS